MDKPTFNFDEYLKQKGFSFTNYGTHNLYEVAHEGHHYAVNLQGKKMTTNESKTHSLHADIPTPTDAESADKWYNGFFDVKSEEKPEPKPAAKPKGRPAKKTEQPKN